MDVVKSIRLIGVLKLKKKNERKVEPLSLKVHNERVMQRGSGWDGEENTRVRKRCRRRPCETWLESGIYTGEVNVRETISFAQKGVINKVEMALETMPDERRNRCHRHRLRDPLMPPREHVATDRPRNDRWPTRNYNINLRTSEWHIGLTGVVKELT